MYLKDKKGKANDNGQLRATVAGEIAYEEIKSRAKKGETKEFDISSLNNAMMDKNSVVSADKYGEIKEGIENISLAGLKYSASTSDINDNPNKLDEKTKIALKKEAEKFSEEIVENVNYMKDGWNRLKYLENELPSLEKAIEKERDPLRKNLLETRKEYLKREKSTLSNLKEFGDGFGEAVVVTTVVAAGIAKAPVTTTVIVGGTVIGSVLNNKEARKLEITPAQQVHLQNVAPEFYRAYRDNFTIKNPITLGNDNKNNSPKDIYYGKEFDNPQLLTIAKEFYSNAKTPDEKLSREIGNIIGGAVASRAISGIKNTIKVAETSNHKPTLVITNEVKQNSVYPNFDFDHVIGGDVSKNGKKVTGGHSLTKGDVRISEIIDKADINGIYNAEVEIYNPKTQKWEIKKSNTTMFPKDWSENRIKEEIRSAWNSSNFKVTITNRGKEWSGTADSGIKIKGFINKDKTTAFPEYEGGK